MPSRAGHPVGVDGATNRRTYTRPVTSDPLAFTCPRCGAEALERFYGPCPGCREELRAQVKGEARVVEAGAFEPALHVTPNAVASKE